MDLINLEYQYWYNRIIKAQFELEKRFSFDQYLDSREWIINEIDKNVEIEEYT